MHEVNPPIRRHRDVLFFIYNKRSNSTTLLDKCFGPGITHAAKTAHATGSIEKLQEKHPLYTHHQTTKKKRGRAHLDGEDAVAAAAGVVHRGASHGPAGHPLIDQPLHACRRGHHHLLQTGAPSRKGFFFYRTGEIRRGTQAVKIESTRCKKQIFAMFFFCSPSPEKLDPLRVLTQLKKSVLLSFFHR